MKRPFRMITSKQILSQICPGDWLFSLDLKDAYFHIQIAPPPPAVLEIRLWGSGLSINVPSLWAVPGSPHFYEVHGCGSFPAEKDGYSHPELPRRLAHFGPVEGRASITQIRAPQPLECRMWAVVTPECTLAIQQFFKAPDWPNLLLYAFHPIALILQVIRRIREQNHRVLLVTPLWRNQHWFAELARLLTAALWPIPLRRDLLSQENGTIWLPQPEQWVLHLWPLNGSLRAFPKECAK